jgi:hypothetical protein
MGADHLSNLTKVTPEILNVGLKLTSLPAGAASDLDVSPAGMSDCFLGMCSLARCVTAY